MATQTLGLRLRHLRRDRSLTLSRLAASAGLSVSYLNDIEHDRTVPTLKTLGSIADALGLSVRDFLKDVHSYDHD